MLIYVEVNAYMCVCVAHACPVSMKRVFVFDGAGVMEGFELPDVGIEPLSFERSISVFNITEFLCL